MALTLAQLKHIVATSDKKHFCVLRRRVGAGGGVAHEDITVHEVALAEVHAWLEARAETGVLIDPKVYAGLYFIERAT